MSTNVILKENLVERAYIFYSQILDQTSRLLSLNTSKVEICLIISTY